MSIASVVQTSIVKMQSGKSHQTTDVLAVEEPLEIRVEYGPKNNRTIQNISVTMRTPGHDAELATGFLFTEGIVKNAREIGPVNHCFIACAENKENVIQVNLDENTRPNLKNTERNFYTTSSCGVCGKASISAIKTVTEQHQQNSDALFIDENMLCSLPGKLLQHQEIFSSTGGLHASALFDLDGELLLVREDVGRHNALDKLIGAALNQNLLPLNKHILLLSGRASFELIQKAVMAGVKAITAVGAPSSLAVQLAKEFNITLIGFLRNNRFNVYSGVSEQVSGISNETVVVNGE